MACPSQERGGSRLCRACRAPAPSPLPWGLLLPPGLPKGEPAGPLSAVTQATSPRDASHKPRRRLPAGPAEVTSKPGPHILWCCARRAPRGEHGPLPSEARQARRRPPLPPPAQPGRQARRGSSSRPRSPPGSASQDPPRTSPCSPGGRPCGSFRLNPTSALAQGRLLGPRCALSRVSPSYIGTCGPKCSRSPVSPHPCLRPAPLVPWWTPWMSVGAGLGPRATAPAHLSVSGE